MPASQEQTRLEYGIFTDQDTYAMAHLLAETFSRRDPPAAAVGRNPGEFEAFVQLVCPKAAAEGLTIVARRADTRKLVGALVTEDGASALPDALEQLSPEFEPIFDILNQLGTDYRAGRTPHPGESRHLFLLGVAEPDSGRGVAQQLVSTYLAHGVAKGYQLAVTEATGKVSQHIFRKLGFAECVRRSYASHRCAESAPFASIAAEGGPILMDKLLST